MLYQLYHVISTNSSALLVEQTNLAKSGTAPFTHFLEVLTERRISRAKDEWHWHLRPATWHTVGSRLGLRAVCPCFSMEQNQLRDLSLYDFGQLNLTVTTCKYVEGGPDGEASEVV